jgi:hypothetical protein
LFRLTEKEEKLLRLALDKGAQAGERAAATEKLAQSLWARGVDAYDFISALAGDIDEETKQRIHKEGWQAGYADGAQAGGGINLQREQQIISEAYQAGFADGSADGPATLGVSPGMAAGHAATPDRAKTVAMYLALAGLAGGVWLCMPHEPEVRRAQLVKLPPSYYSPEPHYKRHHHAAASISRRDDNS